ncbi:uncharacterized protein Fot_28750 [Forsythia ovata]|uniref:Uncharacterized protein n=1 Tax=Forsythia ovata TaxID=205694 RepID=A0ABD1TQ00_9LAMI
MAKVSGRKILHLDLDSCLFHSYPDGHSMPDLGESSKQGFKTSKRAKKASVVAATREENEGIRILGEGSNCNPLIRPDNAQHDLQHDEEELTNNVTTTEKVKKGRGRAKLNYLNKGKCAKLPVEFNERGQPICKGSNKLSSFLGLHFFDALPPSDWQTGEFKSFSS